jgi:DNA-binding PadR family transcriptional regulator
VKVNYPLGNRQLSCLRSLKRFEGWPGDFVWIDYSTTLTVMKSLERRGLAKSEQRVTGYGREYIHYSITDEGDRVVDELRKIGARQVAALGGLHVDGD